MLDRPHAGGGRLPLTAALTLIALVAGEVSAHDIPNARVDRATQITIRPGRLLVDYEVSLAELTLTQELKTLIGSLPGAGREEWFDAYGRETGPMNARGFLVTVDGGECALGVAGFDLVVEEHPRYTFHFEAPLPPSGRLTIHDTNFLTSEGTSRLALVGEGVKVSGGELPTDVARVAAVPLWQLSDEEERRTRYAAIEFEAAGSAPRASPTDAESAATVPVASLADRGRSGGLTALLGSGSRGSLAFLMGLALLLGAAHALLPGHGKTIVAAAMAGERGGWLRGALLGVVTTAAHLGSVLLIALGLWWTHSTRFAEWDRVLERSSGFLIAAVGLWRLGRWFCDSAEVLHVHSGRRPRTLGGLVALGLAAGIVPCWDAVALVVFGEAVGRLGLAVLLVLAFSVGLGFVLTAVGALAGRLDAATAAVSPAWRRALPLAGSLVLSGLGLYLLYRPA